MNKAASYPLGYSDQEAQRLAEQASQMEGFTEGVFRRAGLEPGMQVLDIGSGVGDVSFLAARLVGDTGAVLGVERAAASVETARRRAEEIGLRNVAFAQSELAEFDTERTFDMIVGRFILSYLPDREKVLQRLTRYLKPGGVVACLELDISQIAQTPPSDLFTQVRRWVLDAFAVGAELDMGSKLLATFVRAGLPVPEMLAVQPVVGGATSRGYDDLVQAVRSLLPVIERTSGVSAEEVDVDTLAARLREDAAAHNRVIFMSRVMAAWTRLA